jgi:hypothetical protein
MLLGPYLHGISTQVSNPPRLSQVHHEVSYNEQYHEAGSDIMEFELREITVRLVRVVLMVMTKLASGCDSSLNLVLVCDHGVTASTVYRKPPSLGDLVDSYTHHLV